MSGDWGVYLTSKGQFVALPLRTTDERLWCIVPATEREAAPDRAARLAAEFNDDEAEGRQDQRLNQASLF